MDLKLTIRILPFLGLLRASPLRTPVRNDIFLMQTAGHPRLHLLTRAQLRQSQLH